MTVSEDVRSERLGPMVTLMPDSPAQRIADDGMMLRVLVGSGVHGTAIDGQDDRDEMGICVEPPHTVIGSHRFEHYTFRTQPEGVCSGPGDLDLVVYGLRKFARLAARGNPTVLLPLFVGEQHVCYANDFGRELRERAGLFVSRYAGARFRGYLHSQRQGLLGLRSGGSRNQGRADIRARYGFDTKFAMHMVRLGLQGVELLRTGSITLPTPEPDLTWLRALRRGEHTKDEALARAEELEREIEALMESSPLPDRPDQRAIDGWLESVHRRYWGW
ncbi:nucleotidyltransferase domain-containing protein [Pseudonocardia acaciae]|uniref:nucleotidyltransferase domain-containing protein n=1 Tax=Pseudonocardia acaciae TaxID=551276 RepID=UPI000A41E492|nr:nucleotidyltransferase domain-containing protein [Pseudonocardia acaciae]